jgi:hypothetical protein
LAADAASSSGDALAADLVDLLGTARALRAAGPVEASWVGRACRVYRPVRCRACLAYAAWRASARRA